MSQPVARLKQCGKVHAICKWDLCIVANALLAGPGRPRQAHFGNSSVEQSRTK